MSRFGHFVQNILESRGTATFPLAFDIGSLNTRVMSQGKMVFYEPTCLALQRRTGEVLAIGTEAAEMLGKTPPNIEIVFPIRRAKIVDNEAFALFLRFLLQKISPHQGIWHSFFRREARIALPAAMTVVQQETVQRTFNALQFRLQIISKIQALKTSVHQQKTAKFLNFFIDVGAMSTEIGVCDDNEVMVQHTFPIGGEDFTQIIISGVRKHYHCEIGWPTAEKIKKELLCFPLESKTVKQMVVRGRDALTSLPTAITISAEHFDADVLTLTKELLRNIRQVCQDVSPEMLAHALSTGIYLTGGASVLPNLAVFLEQKLHTEIIASSSPKTDLIKGV